MFKFYEKTIISKFQFIMKILNKFRHGHKVDNRNQSDDLSGSGLDFVSIKHEDNLQTLHHSV